MGLGDLERDRRFNNLESRKENGAELISILDRTFSTKDRMEWGKAFDENGILWTVVQSPKEAANDPQALANEFVVEVDHPIHGVFRNVSSPVRLSKTPAKIRRVAPEHGQHTEEILLEMGYSRDEIAVFKESKAIL
jgi:crotonobetainyl-CoA:carnitine CoA-transferase CaiB-like acyl-CoA transferase